MTSARKKYAKSLDAKLASLDYDPHTDLYGDRAKQLAANSSGLERLAYEVVGTDFVKSIVFALDPRTHFQIPPGRIARVNRYRTIAGIAPCDIIYKRHETNKATYTVIARPPYIGGSQDFYASLSDYSYVVDTQEEIKGYLNDTTTKSRGPNVFLGEMELYVPRLDDPGASASFNGPQGTTFSNIDPSYSGKSESKDYVESVFLNQAFRLPKSEHDNWLANYKSYVDNQLATRALPMLTSLLPTARRYNSLYNIAELRELPALLRETLEFYRRIFKSHSVRDVKDLGNWYLAYKFGWESTVDSVLAMLRLPEKIVKDVNFFISRNGKPTTLHKRLVFGEALSSVPNMRYYQTGDESHTNSSTTGTHSVEINLTANLNIILPNVDPPRLREILVARKLGLEALVPRDARDLIPKIDDIYNLIPWTWLGDWFSGFGDYLKILDTVTYDTSVVNYALISANCKGRVTCSYNADTTVTDTQAYNPPGYPSGYHDYSRKVLFNRSAVFSYRYRKRKDLASLLDVKTTSGSGPLSNDQKAILTALAAKYGYKRS